MTRSIYEVLEEVAPIANSHAENWHRLLKREASLQSRLVKQRRKTREVNEQIAELKGAMRLIGGHFKPGIAMKLLTEKLQHLTIMRMLDELEIRRLKRRLKHVIHEQYKENDAIQSLARVTLVMTKFHDRGEWMAAAIKKHGVDRYRGYYGSINGTQLVYSINAHYIP